MRARSLLFFLPPLLAACAAPKPAVPVRAPTSAQIQAPVAPALASTEALIARPEARALVDELAGAGTFATEAVGYDGHASREHAIYARLNAMATDAEMTALLGHESPVVRSYAAYAVAERNVAGASFAALLADQNLVPVQYGCLGGQMRVSRVAVQALCDARAKSEAARTLRELAARAGDQEAETARRCLRDPS